MYKSYIGGTAMVRTQIYLTEVEMSALDTLAVQRGKKRSELIREAIDHLIDKYNSSKRQRVLERVAGMWRDRDDLPDFSEIRRSLDRSTYCCNR
jgi:predicted DNA-binding protein